MEQKLILTLGLYGIQAARYYLDIYPKRRIVILESDSVIGGTWSSSIIPLILSRVAFDPLLRFAASISYAKDSEG